MLTRLSLRAKLYLLLSSLVFFVSSCTSQTSIMKPAGPSAARINLIWWILFGMASIIFITVMIVLTIALRHTPTGDSKPPLEANSDDNSFMGSVRFVVLSGIGMPAISLLVVFALTMMSIQSLRLPLDEQMITIEVTGHQYWWEVRYPDHDISTANELTIPIDTPVRVILYTDDVIHSFWLPELQGKMDMIPGQQNITWIEASRVGRYVGICTEFCGVQHANMRFLVTAQTSEDFEAWIQEKQQPASEPTESDELVSRGWDVFQDEGRCAQCHAIKGTNATGDLGPDLTHFASRETIGAGTAPNTPGYLAGWIVDAQSLKPGALMPPITLESDDLQALLAFLATLE